MIRCEVCGTDNDAKLTFCSNCGHRLKPKQREVPPTPATAMRKAQLPGLAAAEAEESHGDAAGHARPSAPALDLGEGESDGGDGKERCNQCGATSPRGYRFCISCGAGLKARPAGRSASGSRKGSKRKSRRGSEARPRESSEPEQAHAAARIHCPQCGAAARTTDRFCKSCGYNLADDLAQEKVAGEVGRFPLADAVSGSGSSGTGSSGTGSSGTGSSGTGSSGSGSSGTGSSGSGPSAPLGAGARDGEETGHAAPEPDPALAAEPERRSAERRGSFEVSTANEEASGKLVVIVEDGSEGRTLELRGRQMDIGSREGDIVLSEDRYLSPRHARFFRQDDRWYLRDLDSVNGVYRRLRNPVSLRDGDLVLLGLEVLQFQLVDHGERGLGHAIQHSVLVFGSPAATRRARLCQRTVEGVIRDVYHLVSDETTVGRETGDIVFTSDPFMSRRHAAIQWDEGAQEYVLTDLNSSNGTYLAIRQDVQLLDGDYIRLGQHLFRVDLP